MAGFSRQALGWCQATAGGDYNGIAPSPPDENGVLDFNQRTPASRRRGGRRRRTLADADSGRFSHQDCHRDRKTSKPHSASQSWCPTKHTPNPFNPSTTIRLAPLARSGTMRGWLSTIRAAAELFERWRTKSSTKACTSLSWNGRDRRGMPVRVGNLLEAALTAAGYINSRENGAAQVENRRGLQLNSFPPGERIGPLESYLVPCLSSSAP